MFPVTEHRFLPFDHVYGNIEKELNEKEVLVNPKEVNEIINTKCDRCTVRGEVAYRSDIETYKRLTNVGKTVKDCVPEEVLKKNELNSNKKKDVDKLLKKH